MRTKETIAAEIAEQARILAESVQAGNEAQRRLGLLLAELNVRGEPTARAIIHIAAAAFSLPADTLLSKSRKEWVFLARACAMEMMRESGWTQERIGLAFVSDDKPGGLDHSTVKHAVKTLKDRMAQDESLRNRVTRAIDTMNRGGKPE